MSARLRTRPIAGLLVLVVIALVLVGIAFAAYHGSDQTPPSSCAAAATLLRRTVTDADTARQDAAATGKASLAPLQSDATRLTNQMQNEQSSDLAYDERMLPVTDAITQAAADEGTPKIATDLDQVTAALSAVASYCGV